MATVHTKIFSIPPANDVWFLSQDMTTGATATTFTNGDYPHFAGKIALSHNNTAAVSITIVYLRADSGESYSEVISVPASDVSYTTFAAYELVSVTWPSNAYTLKVGHQETAYIYAPGLQQDGLVGACFHPFATINTTDVGDAVAAKVAIVTSPAAASCGFDRASNCLFYNYPVDGSSYVQAGNLVVSTTCGL